MTAAGNVMKLFGGYELVGVGFDEDEWNGPGSGWVNRYDVSYY